MKTPAVSAFTALVALCIKASIALPAPAPALIALDLPSLPGLPAPTSVPEAGDVLGSFASAVANGFSNDASELANAVNAFASLISTGSPTATPTDIAAAQETLSSMIASRPAMPTGGLFVDAVELVANSFSLRDIGQHVLEGSDPLSPLNSISNRNTQQPKHAVYPHANSTDAPYSLSENDLRSAIYIPDTFKYGAGSAVPLVFVPGTAAFGGTTFESNMIKLLQGSDIADPVWLNIPGALLGDIQTNAEYVAYAISYIQGITNRKVALASWSQGSMDIAWAFTYWPSTRAKVTDVINYSGDYHGTELAYLLCPGFPNVACPPSVLQQEYNSTFVKTLRSAGGASAYVPTTTIYSAFFDEIVEPQDGTSASSFIQDTRNVGVTNNEIQSVCSGKTGGGFYTHEGVMYSPLAYYLTVDALTHDGPGSVERIDMGKACGNIVAPGLSLDDVFATEALIPVALLNIVAYPHKLTEEPAIRSYARKN